MIDIVERARRRMNEPWTSDSPHFFGELADEIERLRAALDEIVMTCTCDAIETARAALEGKP
jgi:hypothetical protein